MNPIIKTTVFLVALCQMACQSNQTQSTAKTPTDTTTAVTTTIAGGDQDEHGCKGSAGYSWSALRKTCVRPFDQLKLMPEDVAGKSYIAAAFLLFNDDQSKAELFLPDQQNTLILDRTGEEGNYRWKNDSLELSAWKGYVLKRKGKIVYHGE